MKTVQAYRFALDLTPGQERDLARRSLGTGGVSNGATNTVLADNLPLY